MDQRYVYSAWRELIAYNTKTVEHLRGTVCRFRMKLKKGVIWQKRLAYKHRFTINVKYCHDLSLQSNNISRIIRCIYDC